MDDKNPPLRLVDADETLDDSDVDSRHSRSVGDHLHNAELLV